MKKRLLLFTLLILGLSAAGLAQANVKTLVKTAEKQFQETDFRACMETCKEILLEDAENQKALTLRGAMFALFDQHKAAFEDLSHVIEQKSKDPLAYLYRGYVLYRAGEYKLAAEDLDKAIDLDPQNSAAYRYRSRLRLETNDERGAIADIDKGLQLDPKNPRVHFERGMTLFELNQIEAAIAAMNRALELGSRDSAYVYYILGISFEGQEKPKEAEANYRKAIAVAPDFAAPWSSIASLKMEAKDLEGALAACEQGILADSTDGNSHGNKGRCLILMDRIPEAGVALDKAIALGGMGLPMALKSKGDWYMLQGNAESAIAQFSKAILKNPSLEDAYIARGGARTSLKSYAKAIEDFQKALKLNPENIEIRFLLGDAQYKAGLMAESRANLNAYCKAIPDNSWAWLHLATISQQENKHLQAIEEFKKANACPDADSAAVYYSRAISYLELKMIKEANSDVDSALSFHSTDPTVLLSLGYELNQLERYEEALQVLEQAIALDSTFAYAYNNRGFAKYKLGQYEAAILDFNKSIALKNDYYHWPPYNRANALRALGRDKEAIDDFNLSLSYKADYAVALNDRGETWEKLGNMDKAVSDYQEALKADPDLETAKKNLQRLGK